MLHGSNTIQTNFERYYNYYYYHYSVRLVDRFSGLLLMNLVIYFVMMKLFS